MRESMKNSALSYTGERVYIEIPPFSFLEGDSTVCSHPWITHLLGHLPEEITTDAQRIHKAAHSATVKTEKRNVQQMWHT